MQDIQQHKNSPARLKVAVIDDDRQTRSILRSLFEQKGHEVETHASASVSPYCGNQACPCPASPNCPDVILTDYVMPGMDGIEFLSQLHRRGCHCKNVGLITGHKLEEVQLMELAKFNARVFLKSFSLSEIMAWLKNIKR